jgi:hypothetical protein
MPSRSLPPAPPMLKVLPRRQARGPMRRAATCLHSCAQRINPIPSPTPPTEGERRPGKGRPEGRGIAAIAFLHPGYHRHSRGPVDCSGCHHAPLGSTKRSGRSARFELPRFGLFRPRVGPFYPRVGFAVHRTNSLSLSFFIEGERGKEGAVAAKTQSTSPKSCNKSCPRVGTPIHGFSVDCFLSKSEHWRGVAAGRALIHASTGRNACVPPAAALAGGMHG